MTFWKLLRKIWKSLLKSSEYGGFNITIPYKKKVMEFCDELSDTAKTVGCVNTVVRGEDGRLYGYNTDYEGFCYLLKSAGIDPCGMKCLVLGSGGGFSDGTGCSVGYGGRRSYRDFQKGKR